MRLTPGLMVPSALVLASACGGSDIGQDAVAVVDSAGVEIVTSSAAGWEADEGWTVGEEPDLVLGGLEAGEELWQIRSIQRLRDGGLAVLSAGNQEVHVFDTAGDRIRVFGRAGEGPGELMFPGSMTFLPPDTLLVLDQLELEIFSTDGTWLGSEPGGLIREPFGEGTAIQPMQVMPDGTVFGTARRRSDAAMPTGVYRPGSGFALAPPGDAEPVLLGYYPGLEQERIDLGGGVQRNVVSPFARTVAFNASPWDEPTYLLADTDEYSVEVFDVDGTLTRIVRREVEPVPVQDEWVEAWKEEQRNMRWTQGQLDQLEVAWNLMTVRETLPAMESLALDSLGYLWVQQPPIPGASAHTFDVFHPDGRYLGDVSVPDGLRPRPMPVIGQDYFMGVWADELDVETVRIYPLDRRR